MNRIESRLEDIIVVDANCDDYDSLLIELSSNGVHIRLFSTGDEALRAAGAQSATLWIVNIRLPDMSGVAFLTLVRHRLGQCRIILVGDEYSADDELAARTAAATAYVCKPATAAWLECCRPRFRSPAIRGTTSLSSSPAAMRPP